MFNPCHACGRSQIHDVVYINSHQTVFHCVSDELLDRCRIPALALRAGRLSLLLYSPAQDGKHIKCFPLRAELATNLTRASRPRRPSLPPLCSTSFAGVRRCAASPRAPRRGWSDGSCWTSAFDSKKNGGCVVHPRFCCGYSKSINLVLRILPSLTNILAMVGPLVPRG